MAKKEKILNKYYVYIYTDPRNNQPFHVGKGCGNRCFNHLKETEENTDNIFKWRKIKSILEEGLNPIISKHTENLLENDAYALETELIIKYGREGIDDGGILTNRLLDGKPPSHEGIPKSEEQKKKMSDAYWKRVSEPDYVHPCKGKKLSDEEKEMARQANLGRKHTEEHRKKNSEAKKKWLENPENHPMFGKHHSEETKNAIGLKNSQYERTEEYREKVRQQQLGTIRSEETKNKIADSNSSSWRLIDPEGNVFIVENLNKWCKERNYSQGNFWNVSRGKLKHAYGYKCEKINNTEKIILPTVEDSDIQNG